MPRFVHEETRLCERGSHKGETGSKRRTRTKSSKKPPPSFSEKKIIATPNPSVKVCWRGANYGTKKKKKTCSDHPKGHLE